MREEEGKKREAERGGKRGQFCSTFFHYHFLFAVWLFRLLFRALFRFKFSFSQLVAFFPLRGFCFCFFLWFWRFASLPLVALLPAFWLRVLVLFSAFSRLRLSQFCLRFRGFAIGLSLLAFLSRPFLF